MARAPDGIGKPATQGFSELCPLLYISALTGVSDRFSDYEKMFSLAADS